MLKEDVVTTKKYTSQQLKESYPVRCPICGWRGLSRDCAGGGQIADTADYDDPLCPKCEEDAVKTCESCKGCEAMHPVCPIQGVMTYVEDDEDYEEFVEYLKVLLKFRCYQKWKSAKVSKS